MPDKYTIEDAPATQYSVEDDVSSGAGTLPKKKSFIDALTEIQPHQAVKSASDLGREAVRGFSNVGAAGIDLLTHPQKIVEGAIEQSPPVVGYHAIRSILTGQPMPEQVSGVEAAKHPLETAESMIGQAGATAGAAELAGRVPRVPGKVGRLITRTTPEVAKNLVKETQAANAAADSFSKTRAAIETARNKSLKVGNEKYTTVNEALNPIQADPEAIQTAMANATEALKGSHGEPTLIRSMMSKFERGDPWTYEDLQGDYSRLGKELSKGTLPGDEYHAYDVLHEALGDEMQRIANSQGMGEQLTGARNYWRRMKQAFGKPLQQNDVATSTLRAIAPEATEQDVIANRIRLMGSFDPEIPKAFEEMQQAQQAAKGTQPVTPGETRKISPQDIQAMKQKIFTEKGVPGVRSVGKKFINYGLGLKALWDAYHLRLGPAAEDVGIGIAGYKAVDAFAKMLERPEIQEMLTRPTPEDIAQIPPELRSNMGPMLEAAKAKGIKVDPRLYALAGVSQPKRAGDILRKQ